MKFVGGPWDGRDNEVENPFKQGEQVSAPQRVQIDNRWYSVEHIYSLEGDDFVYRYSRYEYKP